MSMNLVVEILINFMFYIQCFMLCFYIYCVMNLLIIIKLTMCEICVIYIFIWLKFSNLFFDALVKAKVSNNYIPLI